MRIRFLSFDSMGTRSMATAIKTKDVSIFIDPGVSLAPRRYGLPPHPKEIEKMEKDWKKIVKYAEKSDIIIITHYHYDHHDPNNDLEIYDDKILFIKDPKNNINFSQKKRSYYFLKQIESRPEEIIVADGKSFTFGETIIQFSPPVPHGPSTKLGWVIQVLIDDQRQRFLYTSDIEGPVLEEQVDFILKANPDILVLDGPMTYMLGYRYSAANYEKSLDNIERILNETRVKKLVIDHHFLRDIKWEERIAPIRRVDSIMTAAHFMGREPNLLEANRKKLWEEEPV